MWWNRKKKESVAQETPKVNDLRIVECTNGLEEKTYRIEKYKNYHSGTFYWSIQKSDIGTHDEALKIKNEMQTLIQRNTIVHTKIL